MICIWSPKLEKKIETNHPQKRDLGSRVSHLKYLSIVLLQEGLFFFLEGGLSYNHLVPPFWIDFKTDESQIQTD